MQLTECPDCGVDITLLLHHLYQDLDARGFMREGFFELGPRCYPCEKLVILWIGTFWDFVDTGECLPGVH